MTILYHLIENVCKCHTFRFYYFFAWFSLFFTVIILKSNNNYVFITVQSVYYQVTFFKEKGNIDLPFFLRGGEFAKVDFSKRVEVPPLPKLIISLHIKRTTIKKKFDLVGYTTSCVFTYFQKFLSCLSEVRWD